MALGLFMGPAAAQDATGVAVVTAQLDAISNQLGVTSGARVAGRLAQGRSQVAALEVPAGEVHFLAACDGNCRDIDLIVRDPSGREVGRDNGPEDAAYVGLGRATAGRYTVEVLMADCTGECHWGVGLFR